MWKDTRMARVLMMMPDQPRRETAVVTLILQQKVSSLGWSIVLSSDLQWYIISTLEGSLH